MVLTVTLNPAIDKIIVIEDFDIHKLHRLSSSELSMTLPGGKGVNIAMALNILGHDVLASGFAAGHSGHLLTDELRKKGLTTNFVFTQGNTRSNVSILDPQNKTLTQINELGPIADKMDRDYLVESFERNLHHCELVVLAGSLPKTMEVDFYKHLIQVAKNKNIPVVLHTSPKFFEKVLELGVHTLIPDFRSLHHYKNLELNNPQDLKTLGLNLLKNYSSLQQVLFINKIENVVAVNHENYAFVLKPKQLDIINMLGYADAYVAGFVHGLLKKNSLKESLVYASACGLTNVEQICKDLKDLEQINKNINRIQMEVLK